MRCFALDTGSDEPCRFFSKQWGKGIGHDHQSGLNTTDRGNPGFSNASGDQNPDVGILELVTFQGFQNHFTQFL